MNFETQIPVSDGTWKITVDAWSYGFRVNVSFQNFGYEEWQMADIRHFRNLPRAIRVATDTVRHLSKDEEYQPHYEK